MSSFLSILLNCLIIVAAFFIAITIVAILWYLIIPLVAFMIIKIFKFFNKLSDKLFKNIKKQ